MFLTLSLIENAVSYSFGNGTAPLIYAKPARVDKNIWNNTNLEEYNNMCNGDFYKVYKFKSVSDFVPIICGVSTVTFQPRVNV